MKKFSHRRSFGLKAILIFMLFCSCTQSVVFDCEFSIRSWTIGGSTYTCTPKISGTGYTLAEVRGTHLNGKTNNDVEVLSAEGQVLNRVPSNLNSFFPNLQTIRLFDTHLQNVTSDDLRQFPDLVIFSSWHNDLVSLDGDLFRYTPKLHFVRFYNNSLELVGNDLLTNLSELEEANFEYNPCVNIAANTPEAIQDLNRLLPVLCSPVVDTTTLPLTTITQEPTTTISTTTHDPQFCSAGCTHRIDAMDKIITDQSETILKLFQMIENYEHRVVELEMQMREIGSMPCSPCLPITT